MPAAHDRYGCKMLNRLWVVDKTRIVTCTQRNGYGFFLAEVTVQGSEKLHARTYVADCDVESIIGPDARHHVRLEQVAKSLLCPASRQPRESGTRKVVRHNLARGSTRLGDGHAVLSGKDKLRGTRIQATNGRVRVEGVACVQRPPQCRGSDADPPSACRRATPSGWPMLGAACAKASMSFGSATSRRCWSRKVHDRRCRRRAFDGVRTGRLFPAGDVALAQHRFLRICRLLKTASVKQQ